MGSTSILCLGLQLCMEPQFLEQHVLINKLCPPRLTFSLSNSNMSSKKAEAEAEAEQNEEVGVHFHEVQSPKGNADNNIGGWSFIQDLSNPKKDSVEKEVYIHPLVKRSSNTLSTKSLEMCTESLGSETGSDISDASIEEHSFFSSESENFSHLTRRSKEIVKKHNRIASFPPPLTSISRTNGVQVRPHREGGRLILKATTISARKSYFKTKRVNGRLRLYLLNNTEIEIEIETETETEAEAEAEAEAQDNEHENVDQSDDASRNLVSENGVGEYIRPSKCKENGSRIKGIPNWEPFWVAIS